MTVYYKTPMQVQRACDTCT